MAIFIRKSTYTPMPKRALRIFANITFLVIFFILILNYASWSIMQQLFRAIPLPALSIGLAVYVSTYLLRALRFYKLLASTRTPWLLVLKVMLQHNAINNIVPFRLGELSFPLLLKRHAQVPYPTSVTVLATARLFDFSVMLGVSCLVLITVIDEFSIPLPSAYLWVIFVFIISTITLVCARIKFIRRLFTNYWLYLKGHLNQLLGLTLAIWAFKLLAQSLWLYPMLNSGLGLALLAILVIEATAILPINGPANFGSLEAAVVAVLLPFGLEPALVLAAVLNLHIAIIMLAALGYLVAVFIPTPSHEETVS